AFRRTDESCGEKREDGLKELLASCLCVQNAASLLHLTTFLSAPMPTGLQHMFLHLLPGQPSAILGKEIERRPQVPDDLIDSNHTFIEETQRPSLHGVGQANGKRECLRLSHCLHPVVRAPVSHNLRALFVCENASRTIDQQRRQ